MDKASLHPSCFFFATTFDFSRLNSATATFAQI
jgi:hypothetical protein